MKNKYFVKKLGAGALAAMMTVTSFSVNASDINMEAATEAVTETLTEPVTVQEEVPVETEAPTEIPLETEPQTTIMETESIAETEPSGGSETWEGTKTSGETNAEDWFSNETEQETVQESETEQSLHRITVKSQNVDLYFLPDLVKLKDGTLEDPDLAKDPVPETEADTSEKAAQRKEAVEAAMEILPDEYASLLTDESYQLLMKQEHDFTAASDIGFYAVPKKGYERDIVTAESNGLELYVTDYENSAYGLTMPDADISLEIKVKETAGVLEEESEPESESESESELETESNTIGFLEAKADGMDMTVLAPDGSAFPEGSELKLYAGEELKELYAEDGEWDYEEFLSGIRDEWKSALMEKYAELYPNQEVSEEAAMEMVQYLYPFYFEIVGPDGAEAVLADDVKVYANFYDSGAFQNAKLEQSGYAIGYHGTDEVSMTQDNEVSVNDDKQCLAVDTGASENGLYSFLQIHQDVKKTECTCGSEAEDPLAHEWDCPVFWEAFMQDCNCGTSTHKVTDHNVSCEAVWKAFDASCSGCEAKGVYALHDNCEVLSRIHKELCSCGTDYTNLDEAVETHDEDSDFVVYLMDLSNFLNSQISTLVSGDGNRVDSKISKTSGWTDGTGHADSDYLPMKFYSGKTTWKLLGEATANQWVKTKIDGYTQAWQPVAANLSDRTSHGARYNNVIYDYTTGDWYDVEFVIFKYNSTTNNGTTIYPYIGFRHDTLKFDFDRSGDVVLQCNIFKAGTNTYANVKVKLPIWDIDNGQYVGIKQYSDGSMDHKYYYPGADTYLRAGNDISVCGSTFSYVEGIYGQEADNLDTPAACAVWEMTTARFYFALGYYNNSTVTWATRLERYNKMKSGGLAAGGTYAVVSIYSQDNAAPALQTPVKKVSSDNSTFGNSNTLSSTTANYYYRIDYPVLDTIPSYHFSSMVIQDALPKGADYVDSLKVTSVQDGVNRTKWFTTSTTGDVIKLTATSAALSSNDFYGLTYRVTFKVKMDPTEIAPTYNTAGKATYTVKNTASVTVKRKSTTTTKNTGTVTTTASLSRAAQPKPTKGLDGKSGLTSKKIKLTDTITFSVFQKINESDSIVAPTNIKLTDTLASCLQYQSFKVYYDDNGTWKANGNFNSTGTSGQTVKIQHAGGSFSATHTWRFDITCKVKRGTNLSSYIKTLDDGNKYYVFPNTANVTLTYPGGDNVSNNTNEAKVISLNSGAPVLQTPVKKESTDKRTYSTSLTLNSITGQYYYSIDYSVLDPVSSAYYFNSLVIADTLPSGVDYVGEMTVTSVEDGKNRSGWFTNSSANDVVKFTATADALKSADFYGRTYRATFKVKMDPTEITPTYNTAGKATYTVKNTASVTVKRGSTTTAKNTGTVTTTASLSRVAQPKPTKGLDGNSKLTSKKINRSDTITFSVFQNITASNTLVAPTNLVLTDTLANCLQYQSFKVYHLSNGAWAANNNFNDTGSSGQTIKIQHKGGHFTANDTWRFDITCKAKKGANLSSYIKALSDGYKYYVIPNKATVTLVYPGGNNASNSTNEANVYFALGTGNLKVNKTISGGTDAFRSSIPNANKTFSYKLEGTSTDGHAVSKTFTVVGDSSNTITDIPVGTYTLTETYDQGKWTCTSTNPQTVAITYGQTTEKTFNNAVALGNLTVTKNISGVDVNKIKDEEDKTFRFVLSGTSVYGTSVNVTQSLVGSGSVSFTDIPAGTYTLTEKYDNSMWMSSKDSQSVTIKKGETSTVSITNTYIYDPSRTPQPAPEKSFDGTRNIKQEQINSRSSLVTFSIFQQVKASEYEDAAPVQLMITDVLDPAFEYQNATAYISMDAGTSWVKDTSFKNTTEGNNISVSKEQNYMSSAVWYRVDIMAKIRTDYDLDNYIQQINGSNMYVIPNTASSTFTYKTGNPLKVEQKTNEVKVIMPLDELRIIVKKTNEVTGENIPNAEFTVYEWDGKGYDSKVGKMTYTSGNVEEYQIEHLKKNDINQGKFKIVETVTPWGHTGSWSKEVIVGENAVETYEATNPMGMGTITLIKKDKHDKLLEGAAYSITAKEDITSPQGQVLVKAGTEVDKVTTGKDGSAVSKELYPGKYTVIETNAPLGYSLNKTAQDVEVVYKDKDTEVTNVEVTFVNDWLYSTIHVTKEIDVPDIVWAHGNPTFTFKVSGTDVNGNEHTYYDTVEFTLDNIGTGSKAALTATFTVPAGIYTVSEEKTARYSLESIYNVVNGTVNGDTAVIDVSGKKDGTEENDLVGSAVFYNKKTTDEDLTHTFFVRNVIAK